MAAKKTTKRPAKKKGTRKKARSKAIAKSWFRRHPKSSVLLGLLGVFCLWVLYLDWRITSTFEARRWDQPARLYAQPLELFAARALTASAFVGELERLGYRASARVQQAGQYRRAANEVEVFIRGARFWDGTSEARRVRVSFDGARISGVRDSAGQNVSIVRMDPLPIGALFAAHGEDRIVLEPDAIPPVLLAGLKAVEDRRFDEHHGLDFRAIARAAWVNLRAGGIRQGGSTLTQQLVKSYFLTNERSYRRKAQEAVMALLLEARFGKDELISAYVNEIYLGQDGARAVHGFGLAAQHYFAKPLAELSLAQLAQLLASVRGPSYYDPKRHPERAQARRDLVLELMFEAGAIDEDERDLALASEITTAASAPRYAAYFPAFVDAVRRQLADDYDEDDLQNAGLLIFTSLDPAAQDSAQRHLSAHLERLQKDAAEGVNLQGAVVVTHPLTGELLALVGSRERASGFNRALDAHRQVGSLIKPVVYLAALQSGDFHMASMIEDAPLTLAQKGAPDWQPQNFSGEYQGAIPLFKALAESVNVATVRLGLKVGVERVATTLARLEGEARQPALPSLLLGAKEMTPMQVAGVYGAMAADGLRAPVRAVREVVDPSAGAVERYPLSVDSVAGAAVLAQLNHALALVMQHGTGRRAAEWLPKSLITAGKSGTTNDFRDAWFAGYSADRLAVVWVGTDDNVGTGLTGSRGALPVWAALMADIAQQPLRVYVPEDVELQWVSWESGKRSRRGCADAVALALPKGTQLARDADCAGLSNITQRTMRWLKDTF